MIYEIKNKYLTAKINSIGAEIISVIDNKTNTEFIWQGDKKYWESHSPVLFPQCGRIFNKTYIHDSKEYKMDLHGFARHFEFNLIQKSADSIEMSIDDTEETRKIYPFNFNLTICYTLNKKSIRITFKILNKDKREIYFSYGAHPGFNVPFAGVGSFEDYYVEFSKSSYPIKYFNKNGLYDGNDGTYDIPDNKLFLKHSLFKLDSSFFFVSNKDTIYLRNKINSNYIKVAYNNMKYFGLWQTEESDAPFLCIEPWFGLPGRQDEICELKNKFDITRLDAKQEHQNFYDIEFFIE